MSLSMMVTLGVGKFCISGGNSEEENLMTSGSFDSTSLSSMMGIEIVRDFVPLGIKVMLPL